MEFSYQNIQIQSPRLFLRTLVPADATKKQVGWLNDPDVNRYLDTKQGTLESERAYVEAKHKQSDALLFGIFLSADGSHIGTIKLEPINLTTGVATIGILIGEKSARGKAYGPEAIHALANYGFEQLKLSEINLGLNGYNVAALRAYEKVGFLETSRHKKVAQKGNGPHEAVMMSVTPGTLRAESVIGASAQ